MPILSNSKEVESKSITKVEFFGAVFYGLGWGISGILLGPSFLYLPFRDIDMIAHWGLAYVFGLKL